MPRNQRPYNRMMTRKEFTSWVQRDILLPEISREENSRRCKEDCELMCCPCMYYNGYRLPLGE